MVMIELMRTPVRGKDRQHGDVVVVQVYCNSATHCNTLVVERVYCNSASHGNRATHYNTLQRATTNCTELPQHTATHCNTLQHTATHCNILQHTATHCHNTAAYCNTLRPARGEDRQHCNVVVERGYGNCCPRGVHAKVVPIRPARLRVTFCLSRPAHIYV